MAALRVQNIFFSYFQMVQTMKCNLNAFPWSKNIQTLQGDRVELIEQLSLLSQLQFPNRIHVKYFGTDSNLNLPSILKEFKPYEKNLVNSLNFYPASIITKVNLVGYTCMQEMGVSKQVSNDLV
jgi:hypothetical protein